MLRRFLSGITLATLMAAAFTAVPAIAHDTGGLRYADIPTDAYAVVAQVRAKAGKENALRAITLPLVEKVRAEPNNLLHFLQESRETPGHFIFYEIFASQADFDAHNQTPHVQSWFAQLPELADGGVTVTHMTILGNPASDR